MLFVKTTKMPSPLNFILNSPFTKYSKVLLLKKFFLCKGEGHVCLFACAFNDFKGVEALGSCSSALCWTASLKLSFN